MARNLITAKGKQARVEGLAELQDKIAAILNRTVGKEFKRVLMGGALELRDQARALAPVDTGTLRDAIFAAYGREKAPNVIVGVGRKAFYGAFVEFGTSDMPAHPFMRPAIRMSRNAIVSKIAAGMRQLLIENS